VKAPKLGMIVAMSLSTLSGCTVSPDFVAPRVATPPGWNGTADLGKAIDTTSEPDPHWWRSFGDATLNELIDNALAGNLDLQTTVLRIAQARAREIATQAAGLPWLSAQGSYSRDQLGAKQILKEHGIESSSQFAPLTRLLINPFDFYQAGFDASWELDLFGRVRRSVEQAQAETRQEIATHNDALVTLEAEVALTYVQLRGAQAHAATTRNLIRVEEDILALTRQRGERGLASEADIQKAVAAAGAAQAQLPQYGQQATQAINRLSVLTGQTPGALSSELKTAAPLPPLPPSVPIGLPSSLVRRRPDIRRAEARLHAATAGTGVAIAHLFPDISLTGDVGLHADSAAYLARWGSLFYSVGPAVSLPIFEGGRLTASVKVAEGEQAIAALEYRKAVLNALEEVENALTGLRNATSTREAIANAVAADRQAVALAGDRNVHGLTSMIDVLGTRRHLLRDQQQLVTASVTEATVLGALYKALGGGWQIARPTGMVGHGQLLRGRRSAARLQEKRSASPQPRSSVPARSGRSNRNTGPVT
jgi:outer membrane protein, multidrug efflux system